MAGKNSNGLFNEKISPFLRNKMKIISSSKGEDSAEYQALHLQYVKLKVEDNFTHEKNERHWQADLNLEIQNHGVERLYDNSAVIEPTMICASHCRYCLRANYNVFTLEENQIVNISKYLGSEDLKKNVNEVLITGGDPFIIPKRLNFLIESLIEYAPNIKIARIATRLPMHDPNRINNNIYELFSKHRDKIRFEVATQINHSVELFPETLNVFRKLKNMGLSIYAQNVLLKGVNDDIDTLVNLYSKLREIGIEGHYLFHSLPMRGMYHLRTSVEKGIDLTKSLVNSGKISGRVKPMYALMTDIGKITLYEGTILERNNETNEILIQSNYNYKDRLRNNHSWQLPKKAFVDDKGYLRMWYLDGSD